MICWSKNNKLGVFYNEPPAVAMRYCMPSMTKEEKQSVEKYPFICKKELEVRLCDYKKK